jgi:hypothetical protein
VDECTLHHLVPNNPARRSYRQIFLTIFHNKRQNTFIIHGHTDRISTPGVGRADISASAAVHIVSCEIVALFVITFSLSRRTYDIHIQAFRIITDGPVRAGISATTAVIHIVNQFAARSITESEALITTLSIEARLSGRTGSAAGPAIPDVGGEIAAMTITPG